MVDTGLELLSRGILKNGPIPASYLFIFVLLTFQFKLQISTQLEPGAADADDSTELLRPPNSGICLPT